MELHLGTSLRDLPGVGAARAAALRKLGLGTVADLLDYYPRQYEDRTQFCELAAAPEETPVCVTVLVTGPFHTAHIRKGVDVTRGRVADHTAVADVTFFNQNYVRQALVPGEEYVFFGKLTGTGARRQMVNPAFEKAGEERFTGRILPVYPLTAGVSNNLLAGLALHAVDCAGEKEELFSPEVLQQYHLAQTEFSCRTIHFPGSWVELETARRRLMFEELFCLTAGLTLLRSRRDRSQGRAIPKADRKDFLSLLPYVPTDAQLLAMDEVAADLETGEPMNRLLQGDVGSGKTTVAAYGAWLAWKDGCQSALMAPTELLAEQHCRTLSALLSPAGLRVGLLTGSMKASEKKKVKAALEAGELDLIVGTHALLSEGVAFSRLALVITDEQHRFGVRQRAALTGKGDEKWKPHVLVMSATPIPRTLALIVYGDLDLSVMEGLPPGRRPVRTFVVGEDKRARLMGFVRRQAEEGRQVYIVCPAVGEDGTAEELKAAEQYGPQLQREVFPDLKVGILHGKMKAKDKDAVMRAFARGEIQILVATTVIEVGVDVPNASLMVVENAERFGLSQLHQLRGRVGRGADQSYCVLVSENRSETARARLKIMTATTDGFRIAEEDLKLRGPGDFFGARQHGLPQLKLADLTGDMNLLRQAQDAARAVLADDPDLCQPRNRRLKKRIRQLFRENPDIFN